MNIALTFTNNHAFKHASLHINSINNWSRTIPFPDKFSRINKSPIHHGKLGNCLNKSLVHHDNVGTTSTNLCSIMACEENALINSWFVMASTRTASTKI
ncbi:hypothetical protein Lal_00042643 [Lupinus albus]|nr:hypothetical protein Lal_00042643 [Lupinus albus]